MKKYGYNREKYMASSTKYFYKHEDGEDLYVRVHMPQNKAAKVPVVVDIHGGGWIGSEPENNYYMWGGSIDRLNAAGIAFVEVNYRLGSEKNRHPKLILDCMDAVDWVVRDPEELGFDADRIASMGGSAGGHLALMTALAQSAYPRKGRTPFIIRAVVDCNGPTDLRIIPENHWVEGIHDVLEIVFGKSYDESPEEYKKFSPIFYMDAVKIPPALLIVHGDRDELVPIDQSYRLHEEAKKRGWDTQMHILHNAGHDFLPNGFKHTKPCFSSIHRTAEAFLKRILLGE